MSNRDKTKFFNQTSFEERKKREDFERKSPKQKGAITTDHNGNLLYIKNQIKQIAPIKTTINIVSFE